MVLNPIPQSLPVHFFGSRPQPPTSREKTRDGLHKKEIRKAKKDSEGDRKRERKSERKGQGQRERERESERKRKGVRKRETE